MIEQLAGVLARVVFHRNLKQYPQAFIEIDKAMKQFTGLDSKLIDSLSDEGIYAFLQFDSIIDTEKSIVIAELLKEKAEVTELKNGFEVSITYYVKALRFYIEALLANEDFRLKQYIQKVDFIIHKLKQNEIPNHLRYKLFQYYELFGRFAKAEDILFDLVDIGYPDIYSEGKAFFERLLEKTDYELEEGNLPREELKEGLVELQKRREA